jgi:mono/diheme cytochrome c family protein
MMKKPARHDDGLEWLREIRRSQAACAVLGTFSAGKRLLRVASLCAILLPGVHAATLPPDHAERMTKGLEIFRKDVGPLLKEHCVKCHGGEKTKGDLDLVTREGLLKGGEDGVAVVPFSAAESKVMKMLRHEEEPHMPEKKPRLPDAVIAQIAAWIDAGAPYAEPLIEGRKPAKDRSVVTAEDRQWWAFQPLAKGAVPQRNADNPVRSEAAADRIVRVTSRTHPIDAFLAVKAAEKKLTLAAPADAATLVRRAYLTMHGVPPTPEQSAAFARDFAADPQTAMTNLADGLLASPGYGERWARHWLDVARFAESSGFEHDYDREGAFHFRDFVIKALNSDMRYDQFVRWQLAGDEFAHDNPLALMATGFLGAGVFPTQITANEVERTRYDAMDDMLSTTGSAFLGLTVGCARCHDHKYDPIPTRDYYRMLSTFTTTTRSVIDLDLNPEENAPKLREWTAQREPLAADIARHEKDLRGKFDGWLAAGAEMPKGATWSVLTMSDTKSKAGATFTRLDDGSYLAEGKNGAEDSYTFTATTAMRRITGLRLDALAHPSMKKGGPGRADNGNFALSKIRVFAKAASGGTEAEVKIAKAVADFEQNKASLGVAAALDDNPKTGWAVDPQFGKDHSAVFTFAQPVDFEGGATLRVALEFAVNKQHNIGRPRLSVIAEVEPRLDADTLPGPVAAAFDALRKGSAPDGAQRAALFDWWKRRDAGWRALDAKLAAHDATKPGSTTKVLVCAEGFKPLVMHSQGANFFEETYILKRGNTELKDGVASQGFLQVLMPSADAETQWMWKPEQAAQFSGRRRSLANWITDVGHGAGVLAARVIVNRVWQHHFGRGLVATPSDFGRTGALPSHPELLDWLAGELIRNEWHLKPLHRLIMTSAAWQQNSARDAAKEAADPANDTFTRRVPQRLEGEALRDSMLAVSGLLDPAMFGPGTKDERSKRRSIYFTIKRSQLVGSMVAFDQPEPLVSQGSRPTTTVTPQALMLMNGPQVREWAEAFASRLEKETGDDARIVSAYGIAIGRPPRPVEAAAALAFVAAQTASYAAEGKPNAAHIALADFAQVLFGLNDFAYVE